MLLFIIVHYDTLLSLENYILQSIFEHFASFIGKKIALKVIR